MKEKKPSRKVIPPTRWREIEALYLRLHKSPRRDREAFLARTSDTTRSGVVRELIREEEAEDSFLEVSNHPLGSEALLTPPEERAGAFRLVRLVGRGGMGTVWLGERDDHQFRQRVAIKLMNPALLGNPHKRRLFERERQTLARMEHPNIVRLIDGGTLEGSRPYLVMEFVEGEPITAYCRVHRLDLDARLALMARVCDAVHYAHQNLVVHRDLKPGNLLVTAQREPKIVDFGICQLVDLAQNRRAEETQTQGRAPLTPRYASPEQIRGQGVTTATDLYSLGVVLYELVTGLPPYRLEDATPGEQERLICERDPIPPSTMIRHAGRDLDQVILKAMHKDPQRRYASAQALAEDLRRFSGGFPVLARPDTLFYRAKKWARRNRALTLLAGAVFSSVVLGILGTFSGWSSARAERDVARQVTHFLQDLFSQANPYRTGKDQTLLDILELAVTRAGREFVGEPAVEGMIRHSIARAYGIGLWKWDLAVPQARLALARNLEAYGERHPNVADSLTLLGRGLTFLGSSESVAIQRRGLALRRALYGSESPKVADSMTCLAFALWHTDHPKEWEEAETLNRDALELYRRSPETDPRELAVCLHNLAAMFLAQGRVDEEVREVLIDALRTYRSLPEQADRYMAECLRIFAHVSGGLGYLEDEKKALSEYLDLTPEFCAHGSTITEVRHRLRFLSAAPPRSLSDRGPTPPTVPRILGASASGPPGPISPLDPGRLNPPLSTDLRPRRAPRD